MAAQRTRRQTKKTAAPTLTKGTTEVEKAQITLPAPGVASRFTLVANKTGPSRRVASGARRERMSVYYRMYRQHPTLRGGIDKIAKTLTVNGFTLIPEDPEGEVDVEKAREIRQFFRRSNGTRLLRATAKDVEIFADAFWWVERTRGGRPWRARRLIPKHVDVITDGPVITGFRYGPLHESDEAKEYKPEEIIHFSEDDPDSDVYGLSRLESLQTTVATDLFAMEYNGKFFENSAQTGTIFNMKNASSDEVERNRAWLTEHYTGAENAHRPLILEGDITIEKSVVKPAEMQFIEGRKFNRQEILAVLDIDPSKLGITEDSNRSTSKEADNTFRGETIAPRQQVLEETINNELILRMFGWDDILFELNESSMRDQLDQMKLFAEGERIGVLSPNFVRGKLGLKPAKGGNQLFIQTAAGLIPLELIDDVAKRLISPSALYGAGGEPVEQNQPKDDMTGLELDPDEEL